MEFVVLILFCIVLVLGTLIIFTFKKIDRLENDICHIKRDLVEIRKVIYR